MVNLYKKIFEIIGTLGDHNPTFTLTTIKFGMQEQTYGSPSFIVQGIAS